MRFCPSSTRRSLITAAALVIGGAGLVLPGQAWAQSFHVNDFSCTTTPLGVHVDVGGVGNTDLCVTGSATVDLSCACSSGGNCAQNAAKQTTPTTASTGQTLQPTNGKVVANVSLPISLTDAACTEPTSCGSGQTLKLIEFKTEDSEPTFTVCIAGTPGPNGECTCDGAAGDLPETINCGPESAIVFPGKHNSCSSLFPPL